MDSNLAHTWDESTINLVESLIKHLGQGDEIEKFYAQIFNLHLLTIQSIEVGSKEIVPLIQNIITTLGSLPADSSLRKYIEGKRLKLQGIPDKYIVNILKQALDRVNTAWAVK